MSKRTVEVYRVCDRPHKGQKRASVTRKISVDGHRYEIDLCQECSDKFDSFVDGWTGHGIKTAEPGFLDKVQVKHSISIPVPVARPAAPRVHAETRRDDALAREDLPKIAERWTVTDHAMMRMRERDIDLYEVLMACERPERVLQSTLDPSVVVHFRENVKAVVNPLAFRVVTVARPGDEERRME